MGGEGGDEVSSTCSWPPPPRNRHAVSTSGVAVPACVNDALAAGLALSLSPEDVCWVPLTAQHRAVQGQESSHLGQCCFALTSLTTTGR